MFVNRWRRLQLFPVLSLPWNRKPLTLTPDSSSLSMSGTTLRSHEGSSCAVDKDNGLSHGVTVNSEAVSSFPSKLSGMTRSRSASKLFGKLVHRLSSGRLSGYDVDGCSKQTIDADINCNTIVSSAAVEPESSRFCVNEKQSTTTTNSEFIATSPRRSRSHRERSLSLRINRQLQVRRISRF